MTGAQLANALNEAAIIAGRIGRNAIAREDLDEALLRQSVGSQQSRRLTDDERRIVAYHEAGHALLPAAGRPRPAGDPQHRPPRAGARLRRPLADRGPLPALAQAADGRDRHLLGGRAAEEEVFGEAYSGAADDLARVHAICVQMVTEFGMTVTTDPNDASPLAVPTGDYALSDQTRRDVDLNAQALAKMAYMRAPAS